MDSILRRIAEMLWILTNMELYQAIVMRKNPKLSSIWIIFDTHTILHLTDINV